MCDSSVMEAKATNQRHIGSGRGMVSSCALPQPKLPVNQPVVDTVQRKAAFPTPDTNRWQKTLACVHCSQCVLHVCAVVIFGQWLGLEPRNEVLCYPAKKNPSSRHVVVCHDLCPLCRLAGCCLPCHGKQLKRGTLSYHAGENCVEFVT